MNTLPRVSVVLPSKNRPALLAEAVGSVLSQSMPELELIVIDDCSQPPVDPAQINPQGDCRLRVERLGVPSGAVAAKNRGIALARAPVVAFLDDDDLYHPACLERSLHALEHVADLDVVFMGVQFFSDCPDFEVPQQRELMSRVLSASGAQEIEKRCYVFADTLLRGLLLKGLPMAFQRPVARRNAFARVGGYREGIVYWDNDWTLRAVKGGLRVALLDEGLYRQRVGRQQFFSSGTRLEHFGRALNVVTSILSGLPRNDPDRALFRQAASQLLLGRAYLRRDEGDWSGAIGDFVESEIRHFDVRRLRFLASFPFAMFRRLRQGSKEGETLTRTPPQPSPSDSAADSGSPVPRTPSPRRILTNSTMLQSEIWSKAICNVLSEDEIYHRRPAPAEWNIAWRLFRRRREADVVLVQGPAAFFYGLLDRLTPWSRRPWMAREVFIPEPNPASFSWRLKRAARRFAFRRMSAMDVAARGERQTCADYFALPQDRFHFVPFHTNVRQPCYRAESLYGLAAGRSGRDYDTFFQAVRGLDYRFVVVAPRADVGLGEIPGNVELHCDIAYDEYLSLLQRAAFVVVPLHTMVRSTGQVVVLEAYAYGKPVVATRTLGVVDYVRDSETGLLCAAYDAQEMRQAIQTMIEMPERRVAWGQAALEWVRQEFTFDAYAQRLFELTNTL